MKKLEPINKEIRDLLRQKFNKTKKDLDPLMKHLSWGDIQPEWWIKKVSERGFTAGLCYKGKGAIKTKSKTGRKCWRSFNNLILLAKDYYESNGIEEICRVFQHELIHLIAKDTHGEHFKSLAKACGTHRYCPARIIK